MTLLATVEDCSRVADQVHWETMVVAVKPIETFPPNYVDCYSKKKSLLKIYIVVLSVSCLTHSSAIVMMSHFFQKIIRFKEILQMKKDA